MNGINDPTRRAFLQRTSAGLGAAALASLLNPRLFAKPRPGSGLHFAPKAKRVIYLFMAGGPSHVDLWDPKQRLAEMHGQPLPPSIRQNERLTLMTRNQTQHLCARSISSFAPCGQSGLVVGDLFPHLRKVADELCVIRSMYTEPINHDPAVTFLQTGSQEPGRPSMGSWLTWGLGNETDELPGFVVLLSGRTIQPLLSRYWHSGFLPGHHQGTQFRSQGDAVLYLSNPKGMSRESRGRIVNAVNALNRLKFDALRDPEIQARIDSFELAYRMQTSVPDLMDLSREPESTRRLYGIADEPQGKGSFARNCLLARRLLERGVRFVQLFHAGWDQHARLQEKLPIQCQQTDQATAALIQDLKTRGMLKDTLIIWGGEFGRTSYSQGKLGDGRDHHAGCFTVWLAGGGVKGGTTYGETDDFGYNVAADPVHVHDLQATILQLLGIDHEKLTFRFKGRDFRLTDVSGKVVDRILA